MTSFFSAPARRAVAAAACLMTALPLAACSDRSTEEPAPPETSATETTTTSAEPSTTESTTSSSSSTTSTTSSSSSTRSTTTGARGGLGEGVEDARAIFGALAPADLWKQFDSCSPTGFEESYECSGADVGQFQFFDSRAKASSTTQLLTELRSSEVVADTGRFVVGWSTLGTTAVVTVVDNDKGQVMQQLVSSDLVEPEQRIEELGLTDLPGAEEEATATPSESEPTTTQTS